MFDNEDIVHLSILLVLDSLAAATNVLLIVAILKRTPKEQRAFSILLLNMAIVDLIGAFASFAGTVRSPVIDGYIVFIYLGPCTMIGARFCHYCHSIHVNMIVHSCVLLLLSFAYRLWMLRPTSLHASDGSTLAKGCVLCTLPCIASICAFASGDTDDSASLLPKGTVYTLLNVSTTSGFFGEENLVSRLTITYLVGMCFVGFSLIFIARRKLIRRIALIKSKDRKRHQMVCKSLTAQLALPFFYVIGSDFWLSEFLQLTNSSLFQRAVMVMCCFPALGSPLITLIFFKNYRKFVRQLYFRITCRATSVDEIHGKSKNSISDIGQSSTQF